MKAKNWHTQSDLIMDVATAYYAYAYLKDSNGLQHTHQPWVEALGSRVGSCLDGDG